MSSGAPSIGSTLRFVPQGMVNKNERRHRFDHWYGAWQHAGVMTPTGSECCILEIHVHGLLLDHHRGDRFEGDPKINRLSVGNATLDTP